MKVEAKHIAIAALIFILWRKLKAGIGGGMNLVNIGTVGSAVDAGALIQDYMKNPEKYPTGIKGVQAQGLLFIPVSTEPREMREFWRNQSGQVESEQITNTQPFSYAIDEILFHSGQVYAVSQKVATQVVTPAGGYNTASWYLTEVLTPSEIQNK